MGVNIRVATALFVFALVAVLSAPAAATPGTSPADAPPNASAGTNASVEIRHTYNLTRSRPGSVQVTVEYVVRDNRTKPPNVIDDARVDVVSAEGFEKKDWFDRVVYEWDGETTRPRLVATIEPGGVKGEVDHGRWAFVEALGHPSNYVENPGTSYAVEANVPMASDRGPFVFLGEHRIRTRTVRDQTIRLVVPRAAMPASRPGEILDALARTSRTLRIGGRDHDEITVFVAPRPVRRGGLTSTGTDHFWASAQDAVTETTTWQHEYVHTRWEYSPNASSGWTIEAFAEFFGSRMTWQTGEYDFGDFRRTFLYPGRADITLSNRSGRRDAVWYTKGAAVAAALDYRIRQATDGRRTLADVFGKMNARSETLTNRKIKRIAEQVAGRQFDAFFQKYVFGDEIPMPPSDPGAYDFLATERVTGALQAPGGSLRGGQLLIFADHPAVVGTELREQVSWFQPRGIDTLRERVLASTYTSPSVSAGGSVAATVERDIEYATGFLQFEAGAVEFPTDGVPDLYTLGGIDRIRRGPQLPAAHPVSVTVEGAGGGPVAANVSIRHAPDRGAVGVILPTAGGELALPGTDDRVELSGHVSFRARPSGAFGGLDAPRVSMDVYTPTAVLLRVDAANGGIAGSAVPTQNLSAGDFAPVTAFVYNDGDESRTVEVPVYVDGTRRTSRQVTVAPGENETVTQTIMLERSGVRKVRVGELSAQRVRVTTPGGGDGGDDGGDDKNRTRRTETGHLDESDQAFYTVTPDPNATAVVLKLSGPGKADFDLFATLDGRRPTRFDFDRRSWNAGSEESIRLTGDELTGEFGVLVDAYVGDGNYTLTVIQEGVGGDGTDSDDARTLTGSVEEGNHTDLTVPVPENASRVVLDLSGPKSADLDLYATLDGRDAGPFEYDRRSMGEDSAERIVLAGEEVSEELGVAVDAFSGSGEFELEVTVEADETDERIRP